LGFCEFYSSKTIERIYAFYVRLLTIVKQMSVNSSLVDFSQSWKRSGKPSTYLLQSLPTQCSGMC